MSAAEKVVGHEWHESLDHEGTGWCICDPPHRFSNRYEFECHVASLQGTSPQEFCPKCGYCVDLKADAGMCTHCGAYAGPPVAAQEPIAPPLGEFQANQDLHGMEPIPRPTREQRCFPETSYGAGDGYIAEKSRGAAEPIASPVRTEVYWQNEVWDRINELSCRTGGSVPLPMVSKALGTFFYEQTPAAEPIAPPDKLTRIRELAEGVTGHGYFCALFDDKPCDCLKGRLLAILNESEAAEPIAPEPPSAITLETLQQLARAAAVNAQGETINIEFTERIVQKLTPWMNDLLAAASPIAPEPPSKSEKQKAIYDFIVRGHYDESGEFVVVQVLADKISSGEMAAASPIAQSAPASAEDWFKRGRELQRAALEVWKSGNAPGPEGSKVKTEREWWHKKWHQDTGIPCDGSKEFCPPPRWCSSYYRVAAQEPIAPLDYELKPGDWEEIMDLEKPAEPIAPPVDSKLDTLEKWAMCHPMADRYWQGYHNALMDYKLPFTALGEAEIRKTIARRPAEPIAPSKTNIVEVGPAVMNARGQRKMEAVRQRAEPDARPNDLYPPLSPEARAMLAWSKGKSAKWAASPIAQQSSDTPTHFELGAEVMVKGAIVGDDGGKQDSVLVAFEAHADHEVIGWFPKEKLNSVAASPIAQSAPASAALGDRHFLEALIRVAQESFDPHVRAYGEQTARDIGYDCDSLIVAVDPSEAELSTLRERLRKAEEALRTIVATSAEYSILNNLAGKPIWQNIAEETLAALGSAPASAEDWFKRGWDACTNTRNNELSASGLKTKLSKVKA